MALPGMRLLYETNTGDKPVVAAVEGDPSLLCPSLNFLAAHDAGSPMPSVLHTTGHLPEEKANSNVREQPQNKKREVGAS